MQNHFCVKYPPNGRLRAALAFTYNRHLGTGHVLAVALATIDSIAALCRSPYRAKKALKTRLSLKISTPHQRVAGECRERPPAGVGQIALAHPSASVTRAPPKVRLRGLATGWLDVRRVMPTPQRATIQIKQAVK